MSGTMNAAPLVHLIWVVTQPPAALYRSIEDLRRLNPGFEVRLWREQDLTWMRNWDIFEAALTPAGKSNLARFEVLHRHGGFYVDADFEWLRPLDPARFPLDRVSAARESGQLYNNALLGSPAGHPFLASLVDRVRAAFLANPRGRSWEVTGPRFITREIEAWVAGGGEFHEIPRDLVYPYWVDRLSRDAGPWAPATVAVHHWSQGRTGRSGSAPLERLSILSRRLEARRHWAWARARVADPRVNTRDTGAVLTAHLVEGSDVVIDLGFPGAAYSVAATRALSVPGRVFSDSIEEVNLNELAPGPGELIAISPGQLHSQLDQISLTNLVRIGPNADVAAILASLSPAVVQGRVGRILLDSGLGPERITEALSTSHVTSWASAGARIRHATRSGLILPAWRHAPRSHSPLIDCGPIHAREARKRPSAGDAWRLVQPANES